MLVFGAMSALCGRRRTFETFWGLEHCFAWQVQDIGHFFIHVAGVALSACWLRCWQAWVKMRGGFGGHFLWQAQYLVNQRTTFCGRVSGPPSGNHRSHRNISVCGTFFCIPLICDYVNSAPWVFFLGILYSRYLRPRSSRTKNNVILIPIYIYILYIYVYIYIYNVRSPSYKLVYKPQ